MRHSFQVHVVAVFLSVATALSAGNGLLAAEPAKPAAKPAPLGLQFRITGQGVPTAARAARPAPQRAATTMEKLKNLGAQLRRALDIAVDLLSNNEADLLSKNKTALLSGNEADLLAKNKTALLSGNSPKLVSDNATPILSGNKTPILSGNKTPILSGNKTPILSGNTFSMFSNIKVEIHIENSGNNNVAPGATALPPRPSAVPTYVPPPTQTPTPSTRR